MFDVFIPSRRACSRVRKPSGGRGSGRVVVLVSVCVGLAGCADISRSLSIDPGGVDPASPVARHAVAASRAQYPAPRLADIPPVSKGFEPASEIKASVVRLIGERRGLNGGVFALPPAQSDTDRFLSQTRDPLLARSLTPPPADQAAQSEAFAEQLRLQVEPPPVPPDGPPPR